MDPVRPKERAKKASQEDPEAPNPLQRQELRELWRDGRCLTIVTLPRVSRLGSVGTCFFFGLKALIV